MDANKHLEPLKPEALESLCQPQELRLYTGRRPGFHLHWLNFMIAAGLRAMVRCILFIVRLGCVFVVQHPPHRTVPTVRISASSLLRLLGDLGGRIRWQRHDIYMLLGSRGSQRDVGDWAAARKHLANV